MKATSCHQSELLLCCFSGCVLFPFHCRDICWSLGFVLSVALPQSPTGRWQFYGDGFLERKSTIFYKIEEMERPGSFQTAANWTRASPKAVRQFLPLDSISTEQAVVVFSQSFIVFFKMGGKAKKRTLFHPHGLAQGFSLWVAVGGWRGGHVASWLVRPLNTVSVC